MRKAFFLISAVSALLAACGGGSGSGNSGNGRGEDYAAVTIASAPRYAAAGNTILIDVAITNKSSSSAPSISVGAALGAGLEFQQWNCASSSGVSCPQSTAQISVPSLQAGAELRLQLVARLSTAAKGAISSSISVSAADDTNHTNDQAAFQVDVYSSDVQVMGSSPASEYFSGGTATYKMTISNSGPDTAPDVVVQNTLSSNQSLLAISCTASGGAVCPSSTAAAMNIPPLPSGGSLDFNVSAAIAANAIGVVSNTFYATLAGDVLAFNNVKTVAASVRVPTSISTPSFIILQSDATDYIGQGKSYSYDAGNAILSMSSTGSRLAINVTGDQRWTGDLTLPGNLSTLQSGLYTGVPRLLSGGSGNFYWIGEGRGCNTSDSTVTVDNATYAAGSLISLDLRFEQHCEGLTAALRGQIHWNANDSTRPPGPVNPAPAGLWAPASGSTPATGNYIYLQSDAGDFIGKGRTETYTTADALVTISTSGTQLSVRVTGDRNWDGTFQTMNTLALLQPGYYGNLQRYPFHNPARGGMDWSGDGRGCNTLTGWFVVDSISYAGNTLSSIDLRFEQHCDGFAPALRGKIHWVMGDTTSPPGPIQPPPQGLWAPAAGSTPAIGNYVYLQSDSGDFIGEGRTETSTQTNAIIQVSATGGRLDVNVNGDRVWGGTFQTMNTLTQLQPGYYGNLQRYPFHNPARGGMEWSGNGRGCNTLTGWFVIDSISYAGNTLASIDLRFEQHCEGNVPALRGKVHWAAGDTTSPPGPVQPPPQGLWSPFAGATPATGNYIYLVSDVGDFIGQGRTSTLTNANSTISLAPRSGGVAINADGGGWTGDFQAMIGLTQLQPGYYADLHRYPFHNPARGGMSWSGQGRGCNELTGWFIVDSVTYVSGSLVSLDLRFEQHCEGLTPALRGKIHWAN